MSLQHGFLKQVAQQISANKKNSLVAELGKDFPEVEGKGYDSKSWQKRQRCGRKFILI